MPPDGDYIRPFAQRSNQTAPHKLRTLALLNPFPYELPISLAGFPCLIEPLGAFSGPPDFFLVDVGRSNEASEMIMSRTIVIHRF
jgi:hypothetical protein